jgi:Tetratricopeptide repeat
MAENARIEELRRRVLADPASIAFAALAEEFRRVGRYDEAVETCRTGLQRHPAYLSARVTLGRALIETGEYDAAREELETVLQSAPENLAAIRGLAQIHERLGHSTEMDPHVADVLNTMHAESIRIAAMAPPPVAAPLEPEPVPEPEPQIEASFEPRRDQAEEPDLELSLAPIEDPMAPMPEPAMTTAPASESLEEDPGAPVIAPEVPVSTDLFAGFAQAAKPAAAPDFSFDLSTAFSVAPPPRPIERPAPDPEFTLAPAPEPLPAPAIDAFATPPAEAELEVALELELEPELAPEMEPDPVLQLAPARVSTEVEEDVEEPVLSAVEGPDPAVLATLARLERFLGAIQSLRA